MTSDWIANDLQGAALIVNLIILALTLSLFSKKWILHLMTISFFGKKLSRFLEIFYFGGGNIWVITYKLLPCSSKSALAHKTNVFLRLFNVVHPLIDSSIVLMEEGDIHAIAIIYFDIFLKRFTCCWWCENVKHYRPFLNI